MIDQELVRQMINLAVFFQQIPAPTNAEILRSEAVFAQFRQANLEQVQMDELGNVYACLPGTGDKKPIVVSAHLDTVFAADTSLQIFRQKQRISGPGIGDNATGLAGLFGLLWALQATGGTLPGDLWLVANVAEEGLGNLRGMQAVVNRFGSLPRAYVVLEGLAFGQIYHRALGSERYRITVSTQGGHSWVDFGRPSAIHELARLVTLLQEIKLTKKPRTTLNVGTICGGTSVNTIAPRAELELDLRSEDSQTLAALASQVGRYCQSIMREGVSVNLDLIGKRPGGELQSDDPLVALAQKCLQALGVTPRLNIGSTDANIPLSRGLPAVCVGLTKGGGAHTLQEFIEIDPVSRGLAQLVALVLGIYALP
jgi:tripeptide aminopeptidase